MVDFRKISQRRKAEQFVVNVRVAKRGTYHYCGRANAVYGAGMFGNPFTHLAYGMAKYKVATRLDAVTEHELWLTTDKYANDPWLAAQKQNVLALLPNLKGLKLGCWCAPDLCHCLTLAILANDIPY